MVKGKENTHAFKHDYNLSVSGTLDGSPEEIFARCEKLHCEIKYGGMVWVTLDPNHTMDVEQWAAGAFDCI